MKQVFKKICRVLLIAAVWIFVWWFASWKFGKPLLFPSPLAVFERWLQLLQTAEFYRVTANSLWNVLIGILTALLTATLLAILTYRLSLLREVLLPFMAVIKATPVASFIILALIFLGAANVPSFITFLIVFPVVWTNLDEGLQNIDPQLSSVARIYRFSSVKRLKVLIFPSVKPYFISACRTSLGLAWKAGIAAEIIAMPPNTIGTMIGDAKLYILTTDMFAWTLTVILLSISIEYLCAALLQRFGASMQRKERL